MHSLAVASERRAQAARLAGAGAIAVLGQLTVDMPGGYFGPSDRSTSTGALFSAAIVVLTLTTATGLIRDRRWAWLLAILTSGLVVGAFVPPLMSDPVVAGGVVVWNLLVLARFLFPTRRRPATIPGGEPTGRDERWIVLNGRAVRHLILVSLVSTVAVVGYGLGVRTPARALCLLLDAAALASTVPLIVELLRTGRRSPVLPLAMIAAGIVAAVAGYPDAALTLLALALGSIGLLILLRSPTASELLVAFFDRPAALVVVSFALLVAIGTLLLSLPVASAGSERISPVDALFTATSATCVTGLVVLDTGRDFSLFGQSVILTLIQAGGLNIMVLSTFAALLLGRGLGLRGEHALGEVLEVERPASALRLIRFIVITSFAVEAVGAVGLGIGYAAHGHAPLGAAWRGVFHSVSAFCNAGFALQSDSLAMFTSDPAVLLLMAALITLGGIGFAVLAFPSLRLAGRSALGAATQVKVVLISSAVLVALGAGWYALMEWHHTLAGLPVTDRAVNALFQSVTLRTAGFNSVDLGALQPATILMMLVMMFIGASPGGTGGGIKTTTAVVLLSAIPAVTRGQRRVVILRRTIPLETIYRSAAIAAIGALVVIGGAALLLATQPGTFDSLLFEATSAFGTVGLSLGATGHLDVFGKLVVTAVMFVGRIGPLTAALLLGRESRSRVSYPEARIMVG